MDAGITKLQNSIESKLNSMMSRAGKMSGYLNAVVFPKYQQAQIQRWQTEGSSEDIPWPALNTEYKKQKIKKFGSFPGGGQAMMIATGRLASGAMGRDSTYFTKFVTEGGIEVSMNTSTLPYAAYPAVNRPYMRFSDATINDMISGMWNYLNGGTGL